VIRRRQLAVNYQVSRVRLLRQGLLLSGIVALLLLLFNSAGLFEQLGLQASNLLYVPAPLTGKIVIVAIDDATLNAYGRSVAGWPRQLHADLLKTLSADGARVVAFDLLFDAPSPDDASFAAVIQEVRQNKVGTRTVLIVSADQGSIFHITPGQSISVDHVLMPTSALQGSTLGHVNVLADPDGDVRRMLLNLHTPTHDWLSLSAAALLSYLRVPSSAFSQVVAITPDTIQLTAQHMAHVNSSGQMLINYFGPANTFPTYSYRDVYDQKVEPSVFQDKIVLVGALNATGITDRYFVPGSGGVPMSGIEIHANALETLLQNRSLSAFSPAAYALLIVLASLISALIFTQCRWYVTLALYVSSLIVGFIAVSAIFSLLRIIVPPLYPAFALTLTAAGALITNITQETQRRSQVQKLLDSATQISQQRFSINDILENVARDITRLFGSEGAIWLWDERTNDDSSPGRLMPTFKRNVMLDESAMTAFHERRLIQQESALISPLTFQNRVLGVIAVYRKTTRGRFNGEQVALFQLLVAQVAPAIENAALYTRQLEQNDLLEAILASTPDPILVMDRAGELLRSNRVADMLLKRDPADSQPLWEVLRSMGIMGNKSASDNQNGSAPQPKGSSETPREITLGTQTYLLRVSPLQRENEGWVLDLNNISALKELDALKTQMLRMASHDLKNPLAVIMGMSEMMLDGLIDVPLAGEQREFVGMIDESARRMLAIINDLLDIERMRAGRLDLATLELGELVAGVVTEYASQVRSKQQTLAFTPPVTPILLDGDWRQLHEAITNLIGNAIKYTPECGSIGVTLTPQTDSAQLDVSDTGVGIALDAQAKLFTPFYRIRTLATAHIEGTGLGLSLVKAVIEAHGGKISLESTEGQGTIFHVELPILNAANPTLD